MKNRNLIALSALVVIAVAGFFCQFGAHPPTTTADFSSLNPNLPLSGDLLKDSQSFLSLVQDPSRLNIENCPTVLHQITDSFGQVDPKTYNLAESKKNFLQIINTFWQLRMALHERLTDFVRHDEIKSGSSTDECVNAIRDTVRMARFTEDYLGEEFLGIRPFNEDTDPKASNTLQGEAPHLMKAPGVETVTLRSGDLILSRGTAYTSAAIARIGVVQSQFSHLAVVYVANEPLGKEFTIDEALKNPNVKILEAHIEIGSTIRPFKEYVADGNARNFLFRYPDAKIAADGAQAAFDLLKSRHEAAYKKNGGFANDPNNNIPYDFHMNLGDTSEIFCTEMGYIAFHSQGITLPEFPTTLESKNDVVQTLGITQFVNFAPGDLELDTRFQPIAEWRDYRKVRTIRYKDATLAAMYRWMKDRDYHFRSNTVMDIKALLAWLARHADLSFTKLSLPKNMPVASLQMIFTIDKTGEALENFLRDEELKYYNQTGRLFTALQMASRLEQFRDQDAKLYAGNSLSKFHFEFHSDAEARQRLGH